MVSKDRQWTPKENTILAKLVRKYGKKFRRIADIMGRTRNAIIIICRFIKVTREHKKKQMSVYTWQSGENWGRVTKKFPEED